MTICVGSVSKVDVIKHRMIPIILRLVLNLNKYYLVFALSINMIISCLLRYSYSSKIENNCYFVYMNKTFYGHTPKMDYRISIVVLHIFILLLPKDAKLIMIVQLICGAAVRVILVESA